MKALENMIVGIGVNQYLSGLFSLWSVGENEFETLVQLILNLFTVRDILVGMLAETLLLLRGVLESQLDSMSNLM